MHKDLQALINILEKSDSLCDEDKEVILKSAKDVDKELAVTAFKLERTEKVKRTTSILLEETIEELEQKRKAVEKQAHQAKIEATLERIRLQAMAMNTSDDLSQAVATVFDGLDELGFKTIRCGIGIFNDQSRKVNVWTISPEDKDDEIVSLSGDEVLEGHPLLEGIFESWRSQLDYSYKLYGEDLIKYYDVVGNSNLPVKAPANIHEELVQYYHCVMFPAGGLFAFSDSEFTEEAKSLMKRFGDVFHLAFTRHLDLKLAEAQARESQIEAALERVRASTMAMHKSEQLSETAKVLFEQFGLLGEIPDRMSIGIMDEDNNKVDLWVTDQVGKDLSHEYFFSLDEPTIIAKIYNAWQEGRQSIIIDLKGKNLKNWLQFVKKEAKLPIDEAKIKDRRVQQAAFFSHGFLLFSTHEPVDDEIMKLLVKFARVFDQTYTRFLDLKKAETQAREAQIEAALERLRSRTMAMHKSNELADVAAHLFQQLYELDIQPYRCNIGIIDAVNDKCQLWSTTNTGDVITLGTHIPLTETPLFVEIYEAWKNKLNHSVIKLVGRDRLEMIKYFLQFVPFAEFNPKEMSLEKISLKKSIFNNFLFQQGFIAIHTNEEISKSDVNVIQRFTKVFEQTYTRFQDLQKVEAQAREAQIEAALERVRSKTMAMHKSNELAQTAAHLFSQLNELGIKPYRCNIAIVDSQSNSCCQLWSTTKNGNVIPTSSYMPLDKYNILNEMYGGWKEQKLSHLIKLEGERLKSWNKYILKYTQFKESHSDNLNEENSPNEQTILVNFNFKQGFFIIHINKELSDDELNVIQRFARVFEQTYTRFLDLEKAENQNKLIQAENERKSQELEEARQLQLAMLPKELPKLSNMDIAVYMNTATEVGGDYYDFHAGPGETLTAVIGDATGHGMKAGTMVTITKSLFNTLSSSGDILKTFQRISQVIKDMKFRQLSMCLQMIKINGDQLSISSAAMPPMFMYKRKEDCVEEILLSGMPLGAMINFQYKIENRKLESGDVIFLLSDGLPELVNHEKKMYGYDRFKSEFKKVGRKSPEEIVDYFKASEKKWLNGLEPDDDITFVVIKVK